MATDSSVLFVATSDSEKVVYLPAASSVPGRILYIKDMCGNSMFSSIYISTAAGDMIDYQQDTLYAKLDTFATSLKLASNGSNNWMVLSQYTTAIGEPPPPPPIAWQQIVNDFNFTFEFDEDAWIFLADASQGNNGYAYITYQFSSAGSFTYDFEYYGEDSSGSNFGFQFVSSSDLSNPANVNFFDTIVASSSPEFGSSSVTYAANDWVAIGVYSTDPSGYAYMIVRNIST
jgi:hypothetical protein